MAATHGNAPLALTNATLETLGLAVAVLLLGALAAVFMRRPQSALTREPPAPSVELTLGR